MTTYSEMRREDAVRSLALRGRIEETGDTDLMRLMEERDMLFISAEEGREIRGEWAEQARRLVDTLGMPEKYGPTSCTCDVCAITRGLQAAVDALEAKPDA